ncbi:MAG: hypothetical protein H0X34_13825 [Chthoniobacterales bacterium]|nr:hypothetical protein [Chthoniobacterales bacterium]
MDLPAPANGLKLMTLIAALFGLVAVYGQWQHSRRARVETVTVAPVPNVSPAPSPNER